MKRRGSGILLHITSLPSPNGIGDLGPSAYRFADFLSDSGQTCWQILPLNPTSTVYGNSPYSSDSAFAGNPLLISPDPLAQEGLLMEEELDGMASFPTERVDYGSVAQCKARLLQRAHRRFRPRLSQDQAFDSFCRENADWLETYTLFVALKARFGGAVWSQWPRELRERKDSALSEWRGKLAERIVEEKFIQHLFFKQWASLKRYCNAKGILLIGDLPIYVNYDSADVWANPEIFKLDGEKRPLVVAGVPPDYFSATGQLWGNPVYDWNALKGSRYRWWIDRVKHNLKNLDQIRLDHFRGFVACWEVPAQARTAADGQWVKAPAEEFFATLAEEFPGLPIIAEDLGLITPDVRELIDRFGFPGMKILLFAFGPDLPSHPYAPHNHYRNCVVYTGTHDNNTVRGWFEKEASPEDRGRLSDYIGRHVSEERVHWEMIRLAFMSVADTAIIPMQDLLGLDAGSRMNRPSATQGNWEWRLVPEQITPSLTARLAELTRVYGRTPE